MSFVGYLRPSAEGSDGKAVRLPVLTLSIGLTMSAVLTTYILFFGGRLLTGWAPEPWRMWAGIALLVLCIWMNGGYWRDRVPMWKRQTPQQVFFHFPQPLAAFIWGFDVGFQITTYRVTMATWAMWGLLILGIAPPGLTGLAYAIGFCVPSAYLILAGHKPGQKKPPSTGPELFRRVTDIHKVALFVLAISLAAGLAVVVPGVV